MTKEQYLNKYGITDSFIKADFDAVIATEIAKAKGEEEPAPNPIREAYDAFKPIRVKDWEKGAWIKKYNENNMIDETGLIILGNYTSNELNEEWELFTKPQPAPNPIREAYDAYKPIRYKNWDSDVWIMKYSETESINEIGHIYGANFNFDTHPEKWELYTEPEAEQVTEPAKPKFDQDRFEAMFRAVVASGELDSMTGEIEQTEYYLEKLDAFYATKKGGENG